MRPVLKFFGAKPYFIAVFLNAAVDLGHKIVLQNTLFKLYEGAEQVFYTALINSMILLPFILLLSPAGFIADKLPKHHLMKISAWAAVGLCALITVFYYLGWFWPAFMMTFLLAVQSAFYSPAKYSYLKFLFGKERLAEANGIAQAVAICAILAGSLGFSVLFESWYPVTANTPNQVLSAMTPVGFALIAACLIELWCCYQLPIKDDGNSSAIFPKDTYVKGQLTRQNVQLLLSNKTVALSVMGLAIFWSLGQVMLASYPAFIKEVAAVTNTIVLQASLASSGVGIALGAWLAGKFSKGYIETGFIPLGTLSIACGLWLLPGSESITFASLCMLAVGLGGGMYMIPLNALIQYKADKDQIGKIIAINNWVQNIAMLSLLVIVAILAHYGAAGKDVLIVTAVSASLLMLAVLYRFPQSLARLFLLILLRRRYRVKVQNMKNIPETGGVLLLGNHVSWIDWTIVQIACPRPIRFVLASNIYHRWYLKPLLDFFGCMPVEPGPSAEQSLETMAEFLNRGEVVCLFPEGTLSKGGHLAEFRAGFEKACERANQDVKIIPFYMRGLWGSQLSYATENLNYRTTHGANREIIVNFGVPEHKSTAPTILKRRIFDLSISAWQTFAKDLPAVGAAWFKNAAKHPIKTATIDTDGSKMSYARVLTASLLFAGYMKKTSDKNHGLLLPTSAGGYIANMATCIIGKPIINLNYTANIESIKASIVASEIECIYSSHQFLERLKEKGIDTDQLKTIEGTKILYLEDIKESFTKPRMIGIGILARFAPSWLLQLLFLQKRQAQDVAAILFSSGSEGTPKGVELTNSNLMCNVRQTLDVLNPLKEDVIIASLPMFHAFGLTTAMLLPLLEGIPVVCQPDPTNARATAKLVANHRGTILFGSSTFLRLYVQDRSVHAMMLESLRLVIAGAERLREEVREEFMQKFGKAIYEGYGATETSPVASVNLPDRRAADNVRVQIGTRIGSVGMPLPGTSFRVVDPDTMEDLGEHREGMILIGGPQVMKGYLHREDLTNNSVTEIDGIRWYISGDKGYMDEDGFLTIVDRYSRFAKIGGEMLSLGAIEIHASDAAKHLNLELNSIAVAVPDKRKGEIVVLLVDSEIDSVEFRKVMREQGAHPLQIPSKIEVVDAIPTLGSGKPDFAAAKDLALRVIK